MQYLTATVNICNMLHRHILTELQAFLKIMPVVLIAGARQAGKTTLVESISGETGYTFVTLDDEFTLSNASRDPSGWLASLPKPLIIDEVQRLPELFLSIKRDVDQHRVPGRYLLTGSANPMLLPRLGDSLAGRIGIVPLFPFSQSEIQHTDPDLFIRSLFADSISFRQYEPLSHSTLYGMLLKGGFPPVQGFGIADIERWVRSYLQTIMERDVRDIAQIEGIREFPRLFRLLATRSGMLLNVSDVSRSLGMVNVTVNRYLRLLETLYFVNLLPSWYSNRAKRVIKSPKLHLSDTAILAQLLDTDEQRLLGDPSLLGQFLESFVFSELLKQKSWSSIRCELYHFRDGDHEVDFVLERSDGTLVGIEVKSARSIRSDDLKGLKHLQAISKKQFKQGLILHLGSQVESLGHNLWAVPLQALWQ